MCRVLIFFITIAICERMKSIQLELVGIILHLIAKERNILLLHET